jgi:hypothetical protein
LSADVILDKCIAAWKLVSSLKDIIAAGRADRTYPKWSDQFLSFCEQTTDATSRHLEKKLKENANGSTSESFLPTVIHGWELLHTFIKPVLDADNLTVPYPLVHFLTEHIGRLQAVKDAKFVIEISPELNYFQHQHTQLRRAMSFLQPLVSGPPIEQGLGFLAMPCSQSKGLFMNCLLYHEVGHFIAEEIPLLSPIKRAQLSKELENSFQKHLEEGGPPQQYLRWAVTTIEELMEELFADLVAVKLIGVAYTLSYMELLRLVTDLSQEHLKMFSIDHPADTLRFREQLRILKKDKWFKHGKSLPQWKELNAIAKVSEHEYSVPSDYQDDPEMSEVWRILIEHLCKPDRIEDIHGKVDTVLADRENPCELYAKYGREIKECLAHGIVPSSRKTGQIPHPLATVNGAILFWLSGMEGLYRAASTFSGKNIGDRAFLENRVEMWCLKAIEDWLITKKQIRKTH